MSWPPTFHEGTTRTWLAGWAVLVCVVSLMIVGPLARPVRADHVTPRRVDIADRNSRPACLDFGYDAGFLVDDTEVPLGGTWRQFDFRGLFEATVEIHIASAPVEGGVSYWLEFRNARPGLRALFVRSSPESGDLYAYPEPTAADTLLSLPDLEDGYGYLAFCYLLSEAAPSPTPSTAPSPSSTAPSSPASSVIPKVTPPVPDTVAGRMGLNSGSLLALLGLVMLAPGLVLFALGWWSRRSG